MLPQSSHSTHDTISMYPCSIYIFLINALPKAVLRNVITLPILAATFLVPARVSLSHHSHVLSTLR
jgi:hypothetical protein